MADPTTQKTTSNGAQLATMEMGGAMAKAGKPPLGFEPTDLEEAWRMAKMFSDAAIIPDALKKKPNDVLIVMLLGRELGLSPLAAIRGVNVIQGKPYVSAQLKIALVQARRDVCKYFRCTHSDNESATFETERVGTEGPQKATFTFKDAEKAGLTGKSTWSAYRANMLRWRAASALIDYVYSDIVLAVGTTDEWEEVKEKDMGPMRRAERSNVLEEMEASRAPEPPSDFNAETGEVVEASPAQPSAPAEEKPKASGGDPDSAAQALIGKMFAAANANDEKGVKALAKEVGAFPQDIQERISKAYADCKAIIANKKAGA